MKIERCQINDTEFVDICMSGNTNPPDKQGGQSCQRSTVFARIAPNGEWKACPHRSKKKAMDAILGCKTAAEAMAAVTA